MGRSMRLLLASILVFHAGWYLLLPFFAVLFTTRRHLSPADAGMLLAAQAVLLLLGSIAGGILADRFGRKATMIAGLLLRAAGIAGLGVGIAFPTLLAAAGVAGFGGGLFAPAAKAAIAMLATEETRSSVFSWRGIAANVGTGVGPLLGAWLVGGAMPVLFGLSAALHGALAVALWVLLGRDGVEQRNDREGFLDTITDVPFVLFIQNTGWMWAVFAQLGIAVPLYASRVLGLQASIGLLFTISSLALIVLQVPVTRLLAARIHPMTAMALGAVLLGGGLGLVALSRSFIGLLGAMLVIVLGEMLVVPTSDSIVSAMARPEAIGAYFGMATLAWGLGEAFGAWLGGLGMEFSFRTGLLWLPWAVAAAAGGVIGAVFLVLRLVQPVRSETPKPVLFDRPSAQDGVRLGPQGEED